MAKYTKESFLKSFLTISIKSNFLQNVSLVFSLVIHVFHSYCLLYTKLIFFYCDPTIEVGEVFLDISKAFGKVWYEGILFKLKTYGVNGDVLTFLTNYLHERYQRILLNGQTSSWELVKSGVPQGSILGPLLFLIYINDLPDNLKSNCKIFADDTSLFYKVFDKHVSHATLNKDLELINNWAFQWKMQFNPDRKKQAQELYFSKKTGNQK